MPRASAASAAHYKKMYDRVSALAHIGVWECELDTEALSWTDKVYDLFDLPRGSPIDRPTCLEYYYPESRRDMERLRAEAIRTGRGFTLDIRIRTPKGAQKWLRLTVDVEQEGGGRCGSSAPSRTSRGKRRRSSASRRSSRN